MKLYIAGPDVFRPDAAAWAAATRARCAARGYQALLPLDGTARDAAQIFANNLALIREADAVLARVAPFRGFEPDSGTCFELGYAHALGKALFAYAVPTQSLRQRGVQALGLAADASHDQEGLALEDFALPLNLMLAVPCQLVHGDFDAALDALAAACAAPNWRA